MIRVRHASAADIPELQRITAASPTAPQWTGRQFAESIEPSANRGMRRTILIAESDSCDATLPQGIVGFAVVSALVAIYPVEAELESIAVSPSLRGQGAGAALLRAAEAWLISLQPEMEAAAVFRLEVRVSNAPAIHLYRRHGFAQVAVRPLYYTSPQEDAICMEKQVHSTTPATPPEGSDSTVPSAR